MEHLAHARHHPEPGPAITRRTCPRPFTLQRSAHCAHPRIPGRDTRRHREHAFRAPRHVCALNPATMAASTAQIDLIEASPPGPAGLPVTIQLAELDLITTGQGNLAVVTRLSRLRRGRLATRLVKAISITRHVRQTTKPAPPIFWVPATRHSRHSGQPEAATGSACPHTGCPSAAAQHHRQHPCMATTSATDSDIPAEWPREHALLEYATPPVALRGSLHPADAQQ